MLKKYLLTATLIATTLMMTGCDNKAPNADTDKNAKQETAQQETQSYKVSPVPTNAKQGVKDNTDGYIKINPTVDFGKLNIDAKDKKVLWPNDKFAKQVPAIPSGHVAEVSNTDNAFVAYVMNTDEKTFQSYYEKLSGSGYNFEKPNQGWDNFTMVSPTIAINLRFGQDGPNVTTIRAKKITPAKK